MAAIFNRFAVLLSVPTLLCLTAACERTPYRDPQVMAAVEKFYRVYNEHDPSLWNDAVMPTYTAHVNDQTVKSREEGVGFVTIQLKAFPDIHFTIDDSFEAGNRATVRWTATGTHMGELFGVAPTQKKVTMIGITIFRVENGQVAELWNIWDRTGLMQQLEAK